MKTLEFIEKTKYFHDKIISKKELYVGQKVLLFNSRLKVMTGKLLPKWVDPFVITNVFPSWCNRNKKSVGTDKVFKVNNQCLNLFRESFVLEDATIKELSLEKETYTAV